MSNNFNSFFAETVKEIEKIQTKQKSEARKIVLGAYNMIVDGSAVDTSLYKHSHLITYNKKTSENCISLIKKRIWGIWNTWYCYRYEQTFKTN